MSSLQIVLIAIVVVLLLVGLWLRQRSGTAGPPRKAVDRIDTITGWPPHATRALSKPELRTLGTLVEALPEYLVFAQVPLSRFISVPKRNSYADWLRRIGYQCVDFLVCDKSAQVIAVVELQPLQVSDRSRKRLDRIARTLQAAGIPFHIWRETGLPSAAAAREALLPQLAPLAAASSGPVMPVVAGMPAMPATVPAARATSGPGGVTAVPGVPGAPEASVVKPPSPSLPTAENPFDDSRRDSSQDETIEPLEPPPSTWFDDLDTDPVPLSKR